MTLKQAEDINKKFSSLNEDILSLKDSVSKTNKNLNLTVLEKNKLDSLLKLNSNKLVMTEEEVKRLNKWIQENDKMYWREKRQWAGWMVLSFILIVFGFSQ